MKKIFMIVLILVAVFSFGESYEFAGDVWSFNGEIEDGSFTAEFWLHDLEHSDWVDMNPEDWGLVGTGIGIGKDIEDGQPVLIFSYKTTIEYGVPNYLLLSKENGDFYLLGGQYSKGDDSDNYVGDDGFYYTSLVIYLTPEDIKLLSGRDLYISVPEYNGHGIYFGIPEEIFKYGFEK